MAYPYNEILLVIKRYEVQIDAAMSARAPSCLTLCGPMGCGPPCSSAHGISETRTLGCHFLLQGIFPINLGIEPVSPALAGRVFKTEPPRKPTATWINLKKSLSGRSQSQKAKLCIIPPVQAPRVDPCPQTESNPMVASGWQGWGTGSDCSWAWGVFGDKMFRSW